MAHDFPGGFRITIRSTGEIMERLATIVARCRTKRLKLGRGDKPMTREYLLNAMIAWLDGLSEADRDRVIQEAVLCLSAMHGWPLHSFAMAPAAASVPAPAPAAAVAVAGVAADGNGNANGHGNGVGGAGHVTPHA